MVQKLNSRSEENKMEQFSRTRLLIGDEALNKLEKSHVIIFGLGGVGGYVAEALVRSGIGEMSLVDNDTVSESNLNRQIIALHSTIGKKKTDLIAQRALDINPMVKLHKYNCFYLPENSDSFDFSLYDYVIDAVDTVTAKISIIEKAHDCICKRTGKKVQIISSMGTGNKLNPLDFKISLIEKTEVCPLARVMRHELKKRNIKGIKCVYSTEKPQVKTDEFPASIAFVPSTAGLIIASEVIKDLIKNV